MIFSLVIGAAVVLLYIRYQQRLTRQRLKMREAEIIHQKYLLYATIASQEEERKRIGSDLHDEVCGALSNLQLLSARTMRSIAANNGEENEALIHREFSRIIDRVRTISHQLSPPGLELFGLYEALEELGDVFRQATLLDIVIVNQAEGMVKSLASAVMLPVYRIMQELLSNTVKHAAASSVNITLSGEAGLLMVSYQDDGRGLGTDYRHKKGMGMNNIISRAEMLGASYEIGQETGKGFSIVFRIPVHGNNKTTIQS